METSPDYLTRGRVLARHPGVDPDVLLSCPECCSLVIEGDQPTHAAWHTLITRTLRSLTEEK